MPLWGLMDLDAVATGARAMTSRAARHRPRVILLGSVPELADAVRQTCDVVQVLDLEAALAATKHSAPELVLVDIAPLALDAAEFAHALREEVGRHDLPVLVLCDAESEARALVAIERGVDDFLTRPFSSDALLTRVKACLVRRACAACRATGAARVETARLNDDSSHSFSSAEMLTLRRDVSGKPELLSNIMGAFSEQKRVQAALAKAAQDQLRDAIEHLDAGLVMLDGDYRVIAKNQRFHEMYGLPAEMCRIGRHMGDILRDAIDHDPAKFSVLLDGQSIDELVEARLEVMKHPGEPVIQRFGNKWFRITDRRTRDGVVVSLSVDVTPYIEMEARLRQAAVSAEAAARAKADFLATMSHEIRTPMNGVIGMANLLVKTKLDPEQREFAETIRSCGESLLVLINDVLDFSKMEAGKLELESMVFPLQQLVEEGVLLFAEEAEKKGLRIGYSFGANLPLRVKGDPTRVRQILLNLVSNAVKFTHQGQVEVKIRVVQSRASKLRLTIEVSDSGIGMTAEQVAKIGQAFAQADVSMTRRYGGTGLGLSICARLAELMNGKLTASSIPGRGTTFSAELELESMDLTVVETAQGLDGKRISLVVSDIQGAERWAELCRMWGMRPTVCRDASTLISQLKENAERPDLVLIDQDLPGIDGLMLARVLRADLRYRALPLLLVAGREPPQMEELRQIGVSCLLDSPLRSSQLLEAVYQVFRPDLLSAERRLTLSPGRRLSRVLVAEDNPINQRLVMLLLKSQADHVDYVSSGVEAVRRFVHGTYDCVLMDCQMPEMDGYQATRRIREFERANARARTPIIAMTANALAGDREACLDAGMDEYLSKPLRADDLANVLGGLIQPVISSSPSPAFIEESWLERLRASVGSVVAEELRLMGVSTLNGLLADGKAAAAAGEWAKLGRVAHAANGAAGALFLDDLRTRCATLEEAARAADVVRISEATALWVNAVTNALGWLHSASEAPPVSLGAN